MFQMKSPGVMPNFISMVSVGAVALMLLLIVEFRCLNWLRNHIKRACDSLTRILFKNKKTKSTGNYEDETVDIDVQTEKQKVNQMSACEIEEYSLVVKDLTKQFGTVTAVKHLSFSVKASECFGLLGSNGAGKTSTFKMLTLDREITDGDAWVQGVSLRNNRKGVFKRIGYCPQFDGLFEDLTGRENLRFFASIQGIQKASADAMIAKLSEDLNFSIYLDDFVKNYSGGNKRKLSAAVALLGNPTVVYLDEPTTG